MREQFTPATSLREYRIWKLMRGRCANPKTPHWHRYGGRGITVCDRWRDSFANFLADMGRAPTPRHTIDRFPDPDGNYEPDNCRWATRRQQARNTSTNRMVAWRGESLCLAEWAERLEVTPRALALRLRRQPLADAMTPVARLPGAVVMFRGEAKRLADLARDHHVSLKTVRSRLAAGRTLEESLGLPGRADL